MQALRTPTIALVGNPNTGKTTLFNALCGLNQRVGNYPGVTVETKKGKLRAPAGAAADRPLHVIDLPGSYSLARRSPDEMVAVDLVLGRCPGEPRPDLIVAIVDAANLERNLYLTTQVMELGLPVVIALNMTDVAAANGLKIDIEQLARRLGVPVVPIQANRGQGLDRLHQAILAALDAPMVPQGPPFPAAIAEEAARLHETLGQETPPFLVRRLLFDVGGYTEKALAQHDGPALTEKVQAARQRLAQAGCAVPAIEARTRYAWIREAVGPSVQRPAQRPVTWTDKLDRVLTHKLWGTLIFLALMFLVFQSIFFWAQPLMDAIDSGMGVLADGITGLMDPGPLRSLLVDGIIGGVGGVIIFLPQIMILFAFIAILEDCGYMARAAFLMDRLMAFCGLSGKSFIPLLSSMAWAVPGIMATRVIENRRDRLATILVAPLMSCSARLPVYLLLANAFLGARWGYPWWTPGLVIFAMYLVGLVVAPLVAYFLKSTLLRGETPPFVMEMPLYQRPALILVLRRALGAGWMFLRRAGTIILATMILVWALLYFPAGIPDDPRQRTFEDAIAQAEEKAEEETDEALKDVYALLFEPRPDKIKQDQDFAKHLLAAMAEASPKVAEIQEKLEKDRNELKARWIGQSYLGRAGKALEPVFEPLGWDWRIGMAALASFPAREVMVGTLSIIFGEGQGDPGDEDLRERFGENLRGAEWQDGSQRPLFSIPVALSVMVFFALCCQCVSTLAIIKRETNSWRWPLFTFAYMTILAYLAALATYQIGNFFT